MLSLDAIADAAISSLDRHGADSLTMRRLADQLGCTPASLYRHVRSREELVIVVVDRAIQRGLRPAPAGLDWRAEAEWTSRAFRAFLLEHPAIAVLLRGTQRLGPGSLRGLDHSIDRFMRLGLPSERAAAVAGAIATFIIGSVQFNLYLDAHDPGEQQARQELFERLDPQLHPRLTQGAADIAAIGSQEEFETGLALLLDGIAAATSGS